MQASDFVRAETVIWPIYTSQTMIDAHATRRPSPKSHRAPGALGSQACALCACLTFLTSACATKPAVEATAGDVLADPAASRGDRADAIVQTLAEARASAGTDFEAAVSVAREKIKRVAWRRSTPAKVRLAAIEALAKDDEIDTARMLALMLPTESDWAVIEGVSSIVADNGWTQMATALVRSWAREVLDPTDDDRPERAALVALYPDQSVNDIVFHIFLAPQGADRYIDRARADAWALLMRLDPQGAWTSKRIAELGATQVADPLIIDLQTATRELGAIPFTREQVNRLRTMRDPAYAQRWRDAANVFTALPAKQRTGIGLRHESMFAWASAHASALLSASRDELLDDAQRVIQTRRRVKRTSGYPDAMGAPNETIKEWRDKLTWADALAVNIALRLIDDASIRADLFQQIARDHRDTSTEHGGVVNWADDGSFTLRSFEPRPSQRYGDNRFVASSTMLDAGAWSLFFYHFHAQNKRNAENAGPGAGDLQFAKQQGCACLVFTSVGDSAMDVDYYQPNGVRIDLGVIHADR